MSVIKRMSVIFQQGLKQVSLKHYDFIVSSLEIVSRPYIGVKWTSLLGATWTTGKSLTVNSTFFSFFLYFLGGRGGGGFVRHLYAYVVQFAAPCGSTCPSLGQLEVLPVAVFIVLVFEKKNIYIENLRHSVINGTYIQLYLLS